jgi:hypothetical protein
MRMLCRPSALLLGTAELVPWHREFGRLSLGRPWGIGTSDMGRPLFQVDRRFRFHPKIGGIDMHACPLLGVSHF